MECFNTPLIAFIVPTVAGAKEKYIEAGFADYISKPFNMEQIKKKLDDLFKNINSLINDKWKEVPIHIFSKED